MPIYSLRIQVAVVNPPFLLISVPKDIFYGDGMTELNRKVRPRALTQNAARPKVTVFGESHIARIVFAGIPNAPAGRQDAVSEIALLKQNSCERLPWAAKVIHFSVVERLIYAPNITLVNDVPRRVVGGIAARGCDTSGSYGADVAFVKPREGFLTENEINCPNNERMGVQLRSILRVEGVLVAIQAAAIIPLICDPGAHCQRLTILRYVAKGV